MKLVTQAMIFAAQMHDGAVRKGSKIPYIVHPMEAAAIAASLTDDPHILAAAVLHDVMEDCGVSYEELLARFGSRVAELVRADSQNLGAYTHADWCMRKRAAIERLGFASRELKLIVLADKLSNIRAICRDYMREGEAMFQKFNQSDMRLHAWYYRSCAALIRGEFEHTSAWRELNALIEYVFAGVESMEPESGEGEACAG